MLNKYARGFFTALFTPIASWLIRHRVSPDAVTIIGTLGVMLMVLARSGDVSPVITHRFHYTEFEKGFEAMNSGMSGKVVLDWTTKKEG